MVGFDDIVQILDLSMHRFLGTFAFGLQLRDRDPVGWRFVSVANCSFGRLMAYAFGRYLAQWHD
jgi:hypothetical protein